MTAVTLDTPVDCSFAGGCSIQINQPGLLKNLVADSSKNVVRVCSQVCTVDKAASTENFVKCTLPALATENSIDNFKIVGESYLFGTPFSSKS